MRLWPCYDEADSTPEGFHKAMNERWLSIAEYSRAFEVSDMTIRRRIRTGKLKAVLREGKYFISVVNALPSQVPFRSGPMTPHSGGRHLEESSFPVSRHNQAKNVGDFPASVAPPIVETNCGLESRTKAPQPLPPSPQGGAYLPLHDGDAVQVAKFIETCEKALQRLRQVEDLLRADYGHRLAALQNSLGEKDREISNLAQQIEDLHLLVRIVEKK